MMTTRTLAVRIPAVPGESIESWTDAYASRFNVPRSVFRYLNYGLRTRHGLIQLPATPGGLQPLADATETSLEDLLTMTEYAFPTVDASAGAFARREADQRGWTLRNIFRLRPASRFCPHCLSENGGRWLLRWRIGWELVCPRHQCLLVDLCQRCGTSPALHRMATDIPVLQECGAHMLDNSADPACTFPLGQTLTAGLSDDDPALIAQRTVSKTVSTAMSIPRDGVTADSDTAILDAVSFLADARVLAIRLKRDADWSKAANEHSSHFTGLLENLTATDVDRGSLLDVAATATSVSILSADNATAAEMLRLLLPSFGTVLSRTSGYRYTARTNKGGRLESIFCGASQANDINALKQTWRRPQTSGELTSPQHAAVSSIPQRMWPTWAVRLLIPGLNEDYGAVGLSLATVIAVTGKPVADCATLLGIDEDPRHIGSVWHRAGSARLPRSVLSAITRLGDYLVDHPGKIDYDRRRQLDYSQLLPEDKWRQIATEHGVDMGRHELARDFLYRRVTLNYQRTRGVAASDRRTREVPRLLALLSPQIVEALDHQASVFLNSLGIDEPVCAEPPIDLIADLDLPGPPVPLPRDDITNLLRADNLSVRDAARALAISPAALRIYLNDQPIQRSTRRRIRRSKSSGQRPEAPPSDSRSSDAAVHSNTAPDARRATLPSRDTLYDAYVTRRQTVREISRDLDLSEHKVRILLRENGIEVRGRKTVSVDTAQIVDLYVTQNQPSTEIARQLGVSRTTITNRLREAGITIRTGGTQEGASVVSLPIEEIKHLYVDELMTLEQLSVRYGVCRPTIARRLKDSGVVIFRGRRVVDYTATRRVEVSTPVDDAVPPAAISPDAIKSLYVDRKLTLRATAKRFGISESRLCEIMREQGIAIRTPSRRPPGAGRVRLLPIEELRDRYLNKHQSIADIAAALDAAPSTVGKRMRAAGIIPAAAPESKKKLVPGELLRKRYEEEGCLVKDIAHEFGVSNACIYECLHREGIPLRRPRGKSV
ncbi:Helix-turn-helix motif harboring protein of FIS regulatory family [Mycobacteroides abscessus subsp. abscessus]|uniref:TniQ domain-containing protein n=2 Tax=Gordoniaceae TaxID=85026 RepID=L7KTR6_9ACTN|nr:hypothetical protein GOACH_44_00030 [Gordonia aichiensis NBRC 108223]SKX54615.1 Helix-turn-helix motif harboring protein of FIS regulatory family [Mycobacteroides abscessus subsp. abscessus]